MNFVTNTLEHNVMIGLSSYLQTQIINLMKLKQMMLMKIFMKTKTCLILVTIHTKFFDSVNNKVIGKIKDEVKIT